MHIMSQGTWGGNCISNKVMLIFLIHGPHSRLGFACAAHNSKLLSVYVLRMSWKLGKVAHSCNPSPGLCVWRRIGSSRSTWVTK